MGEKRLGDIIDDHCIKCRRVTNHAIVSLIEGEAAKVRCRTCYHDHDYRHEQAPPTKKELKKMEADALAAAAEKLTVENDGESVTTSEEADFELDPLEDNAEENTLAEPMPPSQSVKSSQV